MGFYETFFVDSKRLSNFTAVGGTVEDLVRKQVKELRRILMPREGRLWSCSLSDDLPA